jgi:hypothetical protein
VGSNRSAALIVLAALGYVGDTAVP